MKNQLILYQERKFYVYVHVNKINGKKYFGITCQIPQKRWNHGNGYKEQNYFFNSIQKYGWDNFEHIVLYNNLTENEACILEKIFISSFNTTNKNLGYNISKGGKNVPKLNSDARKKISKYAKTKRKSYRQNYHVSEYNKQRIRETHCIPILQFTKDGIFIKEYPSLTLCEKDTGIRAQHISDVCNGKQKTSGGYIWVRKSDYVQNQ